MVLWLYLGLHLPTPNYYSPTNEKYSFKGNTGITILYSFGVLKQVVAKVSPKDSLFSYMDLRVLFWG